MPGSSEGLQLQNGSSECSPRTGHIENSKFLKVCLPAYVVGMITEPIPDIRNQYPEHISNIISLLQDLVSVFPASSVQETSMLVSLLPTSLNALRASGVDIEEETEKNLEKVQTIIEHLQEKRREGTLRVDTYTLVQPEAEDHVESYRTMPIYPTYNEVHLDERPFLRPNIISGNMTALLSIWIPISGSCEKISSDLYGKAFWNFSKALKTRA